MLQIPEQNANKSGYTNISTVRVESQKHLERDVSGSRLCVLQKFTTISEETHACKMP